MKLDSLTDLYHEQLRDLYSSEQQIIEALPEMAEVASHAELKRAFGKHLDETRAHSERLKQIFDRLDEVPTGQLCEATQGLVSEAREIILAKGDDAVRDAGLIACAQRIEHYEIAGYGCAHTFAKALGEEAAGLLAQTLKEEKDSDERLPASLSRSSTHMQSGLNPDDGLTAALCLLGNERARPSTSSKTSGGI